MNCKCNRNKKILSLLIVMLLGTLGFVDAEENSKKKTEELRGVWVASVLNINYPSQATTNSALLKIEADNIIESANNAGFNAIFLQVRPCADSLYKSSIFPWSKYLTGQEGLAPNNDFDPLAYFIQRAHEKNIQVHAWINPYRITKKTANEPAYTTEMLSEKHPARLHPEYVLSYKGDLYFDPALPEVRDLISAGVKEIIDNYNVDGIHFDDYFYPGSDINDDSSYGKYGQGKDRADWRRDNVNKLVEQVYTTVHAGEKKIEFGISPFGIWANKESINNGSDTKGNQSYYAHYADSLYWIKHSIIDYIAPQIYWNNGFEIADFKVLTDWWMNITKDSNVKLYIGMAAYRGDNGDPNSPWYKNYELRKQLAYIKSQNLIDGYIAFSIGSIRASNRVYNAYRGTGTIKSKGQFSVPSVNLHGNYNRQYVGGVMVPNTEGYLNGERIWNVSDKGFYGILVNSNPTRSFQIQNNGVVADKNTSKAPIYGPSNSSFKPASPRNNGARNYDYLNSLLQNEVYFGISNDEDINLQADANPKNGSMELLPKGVLEEIQSVQGNVARLVSGRYVSLHDVDIVPKGQNVFRLNQGTYTVEEEQDKIEFTGNITPFIKTYISDTSLVLDFSGNIMGPNFEVPENALISSYTKDMYNYRNIYKLNLKDINRLGGYYVEYGDKKVTVFLKKKKVIKDNEKPLEGFNIVVDPGHGGGDTGALGLLGTAYAEKDVVLDLSLKLNEKLKALGANVILTRDKDVYLGLHDRLKFVYNHKPDLFLSIHANSCGLNTDVNKIKGFSVYYSKDIAGQFSAITQRNLSAHTACVDNKARTADFYVIRGTHCPSVLLETGFMPNPEDFDWLCDDQKQDEFVSELTRCILLYFSY